MNERVRLGDFPLYSVIQLKTGAVQEMGTGKFVFFLVSMDIVYTAPGKIGEPRPYVVAAPAPPTDAGIRPPQQQQQQAYGAPPQQPAYGGAPAYGAPAYGAPPPQQQQQAYGAPAYGAPQAAYGGGAAPYNQPQQMQQQQQHYAPPQPQPPAYGAGGYGGMPMPGGPPRGAPDLAAAGQVQPITTLNPYGNKWTIKARVTSKTDLKSWNNPKNSGTLFSIDLLDEWGGEIRATFFKEAADKFHPLITVGRVYLMSGGSLKVANKKFTSIRNDYELQFNERSNISPVDDDGRISTVQFSLVKINVLESIPPDTMVDVAGVVTQCGQAMTINTKAGKTMQKKDITIADDTNTSVILTFWDVGADRVFEVGSVVALKGAKLGAFGGRSLSTYGSTVVEVNPLHVPAVQTLRAWYASGGATGGLRSISEERGSGGGGGGPRDAAVTSAELRKSVAALKESENICATDRDTHCVKAMISFIKTAEPEKLWYPACPGQTAEGRSCNKKMMESAGSWQCPNNCATHAPVYRYIISCKIQDYSGSNFATMFDAEARELFGHSADEMRSMLVVNGSAEPPPEFEAVFRAPQNKDLLLWTNVKNEMVKDEYRLKMTIKRTKTVSYAQENRALLELIKKYPTA